MFDAPHKHAYCNMSGWSSGDCCRYVGAVLRIILLPVPWQGGRQGEHPLKQVQVHLWSRKIYKPWTVTMRQFVYIFGAIPPSSNHLPATICGVHIVDRPYFRVHSKWSCRFHTMGIALVVFEMVTRESYKGSAKMGNIVTSHSEATFITFMEFVINHQDTLSPSRLPCYVFYICPLT